ncbi:hypothetical protein AYI68_g5662 [Smittium mucronatum]|uniref:Uncharacterized protein n=1 Tax=Smittium mucronatum TaxID=133383 RepID=A0A1R0GTM5_9FUNG|nr:hypothetical protein AYI68_g5662 [Smittium mucronatum]
MSLPVSQCICSLVISREASLLKFLILDWGSFKENYWLSITIPKYSIICIGLSDNYENFNFEANFFLFRDTIVQIGDNFYPLFPCPCQQRSQYLCKGPWDE